mgnify:CR=1 FL=1
MTLIQYQTNQSVEIQPNKSDHRIICDAKNVLVSILEELKLIRKQLNEMSDHSNGIPPNNDLGRNRSAA